MDPPPPDPPPADRESIFCHECGRVSPFRDDADVACGACGSGFVERLPERVAARRAARAARGMGGAQPVGAFRVQIPRAAARGGPGALVAALEQALAGVMQGGMVGRGGG